MIFQLMCTMHKQIFTLATINFFQPTSRNRKTFKLKERVLLAHAWITDAGSLTGQIRLPERGFILGTPKKLYHFLAPSPEEKNNWFQELQSKIFAQKRLFNDVSPQG